jgi:hypothetical protein
VGRLQGKLVRYQKDLEVLVRRRICLLGTALAAVPFAVGIGVAAVAGAATKPLVLKCHITLSTVPPAGSAAVDQPPSQGDQYGPVHCLSAVLGFGVQKDSFKVPDSGDTVGTYAQYFNAGSIRGKFDLTPDQGSGDLTTVGFTNQSWTGTVTVLGGTGVFAGAAGKKGVMKCTSGDSVHLTCTEKVPLTKL